jgi:hypothetical protein
VYVQMKGFLEHNEEAVRLDRCHEELCAHQMREDEIEGSLNLTP